MSFKSAPVRFVAISLSIIAALGGVALIQSAHAQDAKPAAQTTPQDPSKDQSKEPPKEQAKPPKEQPKRLDPNNLTAENIAEAAILVAGSGAGRAVLSQIRKNGLERGRETRTASDGRSEEVRYELRFIHGEKTEKDKVRLDSKTPSAEYALVYGDGKLFGIINGATFTPRADAAADFIAQQAHSIDALLRYKENESKVTSAGKDKQQGIDLYVLDLVDKANRKTRYFISAKTFRVLSLEYEETPPGANTAIKYTKRFYDYRLAQGVQLPFRTVLYEDGKQTVETHVLTVQYGVKMEDSMFQGPEGTSGNP